MRNPIKMGGQAVIEGVMMKTEHYYSVAARKEDGSIVSTVRKLSGKRNGFVKLPIVRGFINMAEMLSVGMKALLWSAEQQGGEEEQLGKGEMFGTVAVSLLLVIGFFIILPYFGTQFLGFREEERPVIFNLVDGVIRIGMFLGYLLLISRMRDVKRLFQYHGAEHMTIHAHENNKELTIENIRKYRTLHPRCGTSFLLLVFVISIVVFSFVPVVVNGVYPGFDTLHTVGQKIILFFVRILFIPLISGISYEILKATDSFGDNIVFKAISYPGMMLQLITTKVPTDDQIEVAIASVRKVLEKEKPAHS